MINRIKIWLCENTVTMIILSDAILLGVMGWYVDVHIGKWNKPYVIG